MRHHSVVERTLDGLLTDLLILAGELPKSEGVKWSDVRGTAKVNLQVMLGIVEGMTDADRLPSVTLAITNVWGSEMPWEDTEA